MHVSVHIVLWNDAQYVSGLFASIHAQTFADYTVRLLDNASSTEDVAYVMRHEPHWLASRQTKHMSVGAAHNHLMRLAFDRQKGDDADHAILIANSHTLWDPTMLAELVRTLDEHPDIDCVQPKILRAFSEQGDIDAGTVQSDILDSTGLVVKSAWRMVERGAGEMDTGQYDNATEIFGASGTLLLVRASAVRAAMIDQEYFDADFGSGGEAEDISLRLRRGGHVTRFVPTARAHYYQGMFPDLLPPWWRRMFQKRSLSRALFSPTTTRNYWWVLLKNLPLSELLRGFFAIAWHRGVGTMSAFAFDSESRSVLIGAIATIPRMLKKRSILQRREHVPMAEIRRFITRI